MKLKPILFLSFLVGPLHAAPRPDIVLILADDMGFSAIGCFGAEIRTSHLDALAAGGLRFTRFYNTGRCCPTRAFLLTGLHPHQAGIGHMETNFGLPGYTGNLNQRCRTIAEVLRPAGCRTCAVGKWHVTNHLSPKTMADKFDWPKGIQRRGELDDTPGHLVDLMATAVDLSGASYPQSGFDGGKITPLEGGSLDPVFKGKPLERGAIFREHEGNRAVRAGSVGGYTTPNAFNGVIGSVTIRILRTL